MSIEEILFNDIAAGLADRAFPVTISRDGKTCTGTGLTKRELFAAMAMQGLCLNTNAYYERGQHNAAIAERAVVLADSLLKALAESNQDCSGGA